MARRLRPHDERHRTDDRTFDDDQTTDTGRTTGGCPECDGQVITNEAETLCTDCGLVVADQQIDHGPEWRVADETTEQVRRTGASRTEARHDDGELRGRAIETLAAGAVYAACRLRGEAWTVAEVTEPARCSTQKVRLGYQILCRAYGLPVEPYPLDTWVDRVASACQASPRARKRARELATVAVEAGITAGCQRCGVVAACVYEATQVHPPPSRQAEVAEAAESTPSILRA